MISVLSLVILSVLQVIRSLTDSAQDWISSRSLAKCSRLECLCSCESSANSWYNCSGVLPNNMAQWRDVHGEQYRAQHRALRYTVFQHCRLRRPASSQHCLVTVSQTRLQPVLHHICQSSALVSSAVYCAKVYPKLLTGPGATEWKQILDRRP